MSATRKPGRNFLFVPGPTNVPDRILRAMHVAMEDHRSSDFPKLTMPLYERMKKVFKTREGQVVIFPSSGTGAWESALTNTLAPGDTVLASRFGQFSHLWSELAKRHGLNVIVQDEGWGTGADPDRIEEALRADKKHEIEGVLVQTPQRQLRRLPLHINDPAFANALVDAYQEVARASRP